MTDRGERYGPYLPSGTRVRLDAAEEGISEYGVVVHCWLNDDVHAYDCYIAFFGNQMPTGKPNKIPYVLRYLSTSLTVLDPSAKD